MNSIIISRVDNLGDVVLTLPVAGVLKKLIPNSRITFLGKSYTRALIDACRNIDAFLDWNKIAGQPPAERLDILKSIDPDAIIHVFPKREIARLAAKAKIPIRVGTGRRFYHWLYCNRRVNLARRDSALHEAQLNLKLLVPLGARTDYSLSKIPNYYGMTDIEALSNEFKRLLSKKRTNLILHPKTQGSAREWGIENFARLTELLPVEEYKIFITGTETDGRKMTSFLENYANRVDDLTGKLNLSELIAFINAADGLVAASTGPLHIAAALNKFALGLYAPMRPIHAGRWAPVGINADHLTLEKECNDCRKTLDCRCIQSIAPEDVFGRITAAFGGKNIEHPGRPKIHIQ